MESDCNDKYISWLNDPIVNRFLEVRFNRQTIESAKLHVENCRQSDSILFCKIEINGEHDSMIGTCTLRIEKNHNTAEIGIMIGDRNMQGLGYAKEVVQALKTKAFDNFRIRNIYANVYASNRNSINLFQNNGFIIEAVLKNGALLNGKPEDIIILTCMQ